jgi:hypothetical protein
MAFHLPRYAVREPVNFRVGFLTRVSFDLVTHAHEINADNTEIWVVFGHLICIIRKWKKYIYPKLYLLNWLLTDLRQASAITYYGVLFPCR